MTPRGCCAGVLLCLLAVAALAIDISVPGQRRGEVKPAVPADRCLDDVLVVSLLDGLMVAVAPDTGKILWTFDSGAPLLSSSHRAPATSLDVSIFPGVEGRLYAYYGDEDGFVRLERLPTSVPDLVESSPSTGDGNLILGQRSTRLFVVRKDTGQLVNTVTDKQSESLQLHTPIGLPDSEDAPPLLYIGRRDYHIRSVSLESGEEQWNASYSRQQPLDVSQATFSGMLPDEAPLAGKTFKGAPRLLLGSDNTLQAFNPVTDFRLWAITFRTTPVAVYDSSGSGVNYIISSARKHSLYPKPGRGPLSRGGAASEWEGASVLVGFHGSSLYAIPSDHFLIDLSDHAKTNMSGDHFQTQNAQYNYSTAVAVIEQANQKQVLPLTKLSNMTSDFLDSLVCTKDDQRQLEQLVTDKLQGEAAEFGEGPRLLIGVLMHAWLLQGLVVSLVVVSIILYSRLRFKRGRPIVATETASDLIVSDAPSKRPHVMNKSKKQKQRALKAAKANTALGNKQDTQTAPIESRSDRSISPVIEDTTEGLTGVNQNGIVDGDDDNRRASRRVEQSTSESASNGPHKQVKSDDGSWLIGRLRVGPHVLGFGSGGTVVYSGSLDGRPVAVKRLLKQFHDLARKELEVLILSDEHPNVVRCFAMEEDREFVYVALERCQMSLSDLMSTQSGCESLRDANGLPSAFAKQLMSDMSQGLGALHSCGIVHRDLKPHNVLLTDKCRAKLSDMGLSKKLVQNQSSFESHGSGGSSGWQAPEQLILKGGGVVRQTRAMDVFSLACILHCCMTGGGHPFGEAYQRDGNILKGAANVGALRRLPEEHNLIRAMLAPEAVRRPAMPAILGHVMWWGEDQRLQFLIDLSDRLENEDREPDQSLIQALESYSVAAVGSNWGALLHPELIGNLGRYRRYDYTSLRDLLRVIRNKRNHFRELPEHLQELLGPLPGGLLRYFTERFPNLILAMFVFGLGHLSEDINVRKYWGGRSLDFEPFIQAFMFVHQDLIPGAAHKSLPNISRDMTDGISEALESLEEDMDRKERTQPALLPSIMEASSDESALMHDRKESASNGAEVHEQVLRTSAERLIPFGDVPIVGYCISMESEPLHTLPFPQRPDRSVCEFFSKTGFCKFGDVCVFDHPPEFAVQLTDSGLPYRPAEPVCAYYLKSNSCKYGPSCKFHHPRLQPIYAGSGLVP